MPLSSLFRQGLFSVLNNHDSHPVTFILWVLESHARCHSCIQIETLAVGCLIGAGDIGQDACFVGVIGGEIRP